MVKHSISFSFLFLNYMIFLKKVSKMEHLVKSLFVLSCWTCIIVLGGFALESDNFVSQLRLWSFKSWSVCAYCSNYCSCENEEMSPDYEVLSKKVVDNAVILVLPWKSISQWKFSYVELDSYHRALDWVCVHLGMPSWITWI